MCEIANKIKSRRLELCLTLHREGIRLFGHIVQNLKKRSRPLFISHSSICLAFSKIPLSHRP